VIFTAGTSACAPPTFRFWVQAGAGPWQIKQDYSAMNTFTLDTGHAGTYHVEVDVRSAGSSVSYDAVNSTSYVIQGCSAGSLGAVPGSPHAPSGSVTLTGSATCGGTATYRFWVQAPGGPWQVKQDYSTLNTYSWPLGGLALGPYGLEVDIRNQGGADSYETVGRLSYTLAVTACTKPSLGASPSSPGPTGGTVTITATTSACASPNFRFWVQAPGGPWQIKQDYSASNSFSWTGTGLAGVYNLEVDVRDAAESVSYDQVTNAPYTLQGCSAVSIGASPPGTATHGTQVTVTASATCPGTPTYRFWVKAGSGPWQIKQDYSTNNTFLWTPATAGSYAIEVDVRDQGGTDTYEKVNSINNYTVS
jgi:Y_Y_Y domain